MQTMITIPADDATDTITDGDVGFTLTGSYRTGSTIDGQHYVVAPNGVKIDAISPAPATVDDRPANGAMADLQQASTPTQAFDGGAPGSAPYDADLAVDLTAIWRPGSCIVKAVGADEVLPATGSIGRRGLLKTSHALHVVAAAPAAGAMAPVVWPSASLAERPWRVADVDGLLSMLPALSASGMDVVSWATIAAFWDKLDFGRAFGTGAFTYQWITPQGIAYDDTAYDEHRVRVTGTVWAGICSDAWTEQDRTAAVIRALSNGCQIVEAYRGFGATMGENGGHFQSHIADCLAWLRAADLIEDYAAILPLIGGNVRGQYYQVEEGMFDPHSDASKPYIARRRSVTEIGGGGLTVHVTGYGPASGLTGDTASNGTWHGLDLVKESNGHRAAITASQQQTSGGNPIPGADVILTLSAPLSGLAESDTVYCAQASPLDAGTYDWTLQGPSGFPNLTNPSFSAEYRSNNAHASAVFAASALRLRGPDLEPAKQYALRAAAGGGLPSPHRALGSSHWARQMWDAHAGTVLALEQDVD